MEISVRDLLDDDLDIISDIESRSFSMPWKKEDFKHLIEDNQSVYMVILVDGTPVGTAGYTYNGFEGYINNVVIEESFRGQGLSKILMDALLSKGRENGINDYTLEVRVSNAPAVRLYESLGFESAGVRKNFYEKPVEDAFVMWLH